MLRPRTSFLAPLAFVTLLGSAAHADDGGCFLQVPAPAVRRVEGLTVPSPARSEAPPPGLRLRTHVRPQDGMWIGPDVTAFLPLEVGGKMKLDLLDQTENCAAEVRILDCNGYFNEACQSYSRDAGGRCSSLVALDVLHRRVLWRTPPLTSNNWFTLVGDHVVAAYGFTGEPTSIRVVRRRDGVVIDRKALEGTNFEMRTSGDLVSVELYYNRPPATFRLGSDGRLSRVASMSIPWEPTGPAFAVPAVPQVPRVPQRAPPRGEIF